MLIFAKLIILIICTFIQFQIYPLDGINIAVVLIAMIISCIPTIIKSDIWGGKGLKTITVCTWTIFLCTALAVPEFKCHLPLAIFDIVGFKLMLPLLLSIICFSTELTGNNGILILLLSILAGFLQLSISRSEKLSDELKKLRDTSKEKELLIEEKNRRLIEKQDADIYAATLRERNRIAREIHDNVGHMLTRSILQVGAIKTINKNEILAEPLEGLHETLNTAMTNIRSSVHDLHDESLDLLSAIREVTDNIDDIDVNLQYDMNKNIPKNIKYCFITITKEAVNNVLKHSNASHIDIFIQEHPAFYQLLIHDNGTGIDANATEGIGLTNMRDRVRALNGNIKITTDDGFKILISIIKNRSVEE